MLGRKRVTVYTNAPYLEQIGTKLDPMRRQPSILVVLFPFSLATHCDGFLLCQGKAETDALCSEHSNGAAVP